MAKYEGPSSMMARSSSSVSFGTSEAGRHPNDKLPPNGQSKARDSPKSSAVSLSATADTSAASRDKEVIAKIKLSSFGQRRLYSRVDISSEKCLLTMDKQAQAKLENPPSLADGIDWQTEQDLRFLGCQIIQEGAILLQIPQIAAATAQILFQRFYYQRSFVRYYFEYMVMACLLVASKIEECPRRPRDVVNVFSRLQHWHGTRNESKKYEPLLLDRSYVEMKNNVIKSERKLLNALGFVVHTKHPHKLIYTYLHALLLLDNKDMIQKAWSYMNDGLRTDIFLRYRPETIACACIYLAARTIKKPVALPKYPFPWYEAFDASDRDVKTISVILLKLYTRPRAPNWARLVETLDKLRAKATSTSNHFKQPPMRTSLSAPACNVSGGSAPSSRAGIEEQQARSAVERKRREFAKKLAEMEHQQNGSAIASTKQGAKPRDGPLREIVERDREKFDYRRNRRRSLSVSSRSRTLSPIEPKKFRSSPGMDERRGGSVDKDRVGGHSQKHRHRRHKQKEERKRMREERKVDRKERAERAERADRAHRADRAQRNTARREERRKAHERERLNNQREREKEREKDVYLALGKRRQESQSPEVPIPKFRR